MAYAWYGGLGEGESGRFSGGEWDRSGEQDEPIGEQAGAVGGAERLVSQCVSRACVRPGPRFVLGELGTQCV
jgi:hypothetical protein